MKWRKLYHGTLFVWRICPIHQLSSAQVRQCSWICSKVFSFVLQLNVSVCHIVSNNLLCGPEVWARTAGCTGYHSEIVSWQIVTFVVFSAGLELVHHSHFIFSLRAWCGMIYGQVFLQALVQSAAQAAWTFAMISNLPGFTCLSAIRKITKCTWNVNLTVPQHSYTGRSKVVCNFCKLLGYL